MPLIEGVGDEVTQFFLVLISCIVGGCTNYQLLNTWITIAVFLVVVAWWTTSISEQRHVRTVFLIDRQARADNRARTVSRRLRSEGKKKYVLTVLRQKWKKIHLLLLISGRSFFIFFWFSVLVLVKIFLVLISDFK